MRSVYLVGCVGIRSVKIGSATDPKARLADLQVGCPLPLAILWTQEAPNAFLVERALHKHFDDHRVRGEWFDLGIDPLPMVREVFASKILLVAAADEEETFRSVPVQPTREMLILDVADIFRREDAIFLAVSDIVRTLQDKSESYGCVTERRIQHLLAQTFGPTSVCTLPGGRRCRVLGRNQMVNPEREVYTHSVISSLQ